MFAMRLKYVIALAALLAIPLFASPPPANAQTVCTSVNAMAAPPVVSGTAQVGVTLSTTTGGWTGNPTSFGYQWYGNGTAISGATASTYVPVAGDVGHTIQSGVTATNAGGTSCLSQSVATAAVLAAPGIANISAPVITGTAQVGQTLTSSTGTWSITAGTTYAYQWNRAGVAIGGATASTYVPVTADVGNMLTVTVTATNGTSASATSAATASVIPATVNPPANSTVPTISGTPQVGSTLTATNGTWTNTPTSFAYQWNTVGGTSVTAFNATFTGTNTGDQGYQFRQLIPSTSLTNVSGTVAGSIRACFSFVAGTTAGSMTADIGEQGTGNAYNFDGNQVPLKFGGSTTLSGLSGASTNCSDYAAFTLNASKNLIIAMHYTGTTVNLAASGGGGVPDTLYYSNVAVDQTATAPTGTWNTQVNSLESVGSINFQSGSGGGPITGATNSTYVPVVANIGNGLTVSVTATNTGGTSAPATSAATAAVTAASGSIPVNSTIPTITGMAQVGQTLTAGNGTWTNTPTSYQYQWNSSGVSSSANFSVSGGKILDPNGAVWHGQGSGVLDQEITGDIGTASGAALAARMRGLLPGINLVRVANYVLNTPSLYASFVNTMTANKVVVVFEDHCTGNPVLTGTALTNESNWYASMATQFLGNPYVWFQSCNEPGSNDFQQMQATYNAVRGTGSNVPVIFEAGLGANGDPTTVGSTTFTNSMRNVAWDVHAYDWMSGYSTNLTTITNDANSRISAMQTITSADGTMPVIDLETGNSTNGTSVDPGGFQEVQAAYANPNYVGNSAWIFDSLYANTPPDNLTNPGGTTLNAFGMQVAGYIANGSSTFPASSGPISGATAQTYVPVSSDVGNTLTVSVIAKNATGASAPATSAATGAVVAAGGGGTGTPASRSADLLSILGISGHVGSYADNSQTVADAAYLNIGKWRDGISGLSAGTKTIYQGLVTGGIQIIGLPWLPTDNTFAGNVTGAKSVLAMGPVNGFPALFAVEGPNEPSISTFTYNGFNSATTWQGVSQWQNGWYLAMKADATVGTAGANIPVTTPTLVGAEATNWGLQYLVVPPGPPSGVLAAAGLQYADWFNFHLYPMLQGVPSAQWIDPTAGDQFNAQQNADFGTTYLHGFAGNTAAFINSNKRIITETNLMTVPAPSAGGTTVDKPTQGKNLLNGFMSAWNEGYSAFCIYTFYPFSGDGTEIFSGPGAPYSTAQYIHNFTTALKDTGGTARTFAPGALAYTIAGLPSTAKAILFQKSAGAFELVIWNNVTNWNKAAGTPIAISPTTVTVNFGAAHGTVNVYDPTSGTAAIANASNANAMSVSLRDYPLVVEVIN